MVLGKVPVPGRPTVWITGQGPTSIAVGAGGGCLDIFTLIYPFFPLSPSLWDTTRYRLKYYLKGPLNPKPTNQPIALAVAADGVCWDIFTFLYLFSLSLGGGPIKTGILSQGPLYPKQPTNQPDQ